MPGGTVALTRVAAKNGDELLLPAFTLWWREVVRFYRQKTRVVGVIASPIVFWLVIGSGFGSSFRSGGSGAHCVACLDSPCRLRAVCYDDHDCRIFC